jgi:hypothetical protein
MPAEKKILVAIDSTLKEPYISITKEGPIATWANSKHDNVGILVYYSKKPKKMMLFLDNWVEILRWKSGRNASYAISYFLMWVLWPYRRYVPTIRPSRTLDLNTVDEVKVSFLEARFLQRWKKLAIIQNFVENSKFDFLLLITPSCYINQTNLNEYIKTLPIDVPVYAGSLQKAHDGPFISGGTLVMNKAAAKILITNRFKVPTHLMDDVAFGVTMNKLGVNLTTFPYLNLTNFENIKSLDLKKYFYIRVAQGLIKSRSDAANMRKIHSILIQSVD